MTKVTFKEMVKRVNAGAKLLDKKLPGWQKKVKPGMLALEDPYTCVLGQGFADAIGAAFASGFDKGRKALGLNGISKVAQYGFNLRYAEMPHDDDNGMFVEVPSVVKGFVAKIPAWDLLTALWIDKIKERRAA